MRAAREGASTLWSRPQGAGYYLLPDELSLPAGELVLRTISGREIRVDAEAAAPYAIDPAAAADHLQAALLRGLDRAGDRLQALALASGLTGRSTEDLSADPEAARATLNAALRELVALLEDAGADDPAAAERARARIRAVRERLRTSGYPVGEAPAGDLAERLRAALRAGSPEESAQAAEKLEAASGQARALGESLAQGLEALARSLRERSSSVSGPRPPDGTGGR